MQRRSPPSLPPCLPLGIVHCRDLRVELGLHMLGGLCGVLLHPDDFMPDEPNPLEAVLVQEMYE